MYHVTNKKLKRKESEDGSKGREKEILLHYYSRKSNEQILFTYLEIFVV